MTSFYQTVLLQVGPILGDKSGKRYEKSTFKYIMGTIWKQVVRVIVVFISNMSHERLQFCQDHIAKAFYCGC